MKIAYQGEPGAFSEAAGRRLVPEAELLPCKSFEDVFASVRDGRADYGIVPIENSIGGSIHRNYDLLVTHELPIQAEIELPVVHQLLALPGTTIERLRRVYSHPQALAQCERFLRTLKGIEIIATYDTAGSAKMVADERLEDAAAIASARAGEVFGLTALASSIQDFDDNITRFLVDRRRAASRRAARQDLDRLLAAERAGFAVQSAQCLRAARRRSDQARIAADSRPPLGIPVLRRSGRRARRGHLRPRAGAPRRVRPDAPHARLVRELEDAPGLASRPF